MTTTTLTPRQLRQLGESIARQLAACHGHTLGDFDPVPLYCYECPAVAVEAPHPLNAGTVLRFVFEFSAEAGEIWAEVKTCRYYCGARGYSVETTPAGDPYPTALPLHEWAPAGTFTAEEEEEEDEDGSPVA